MREVARRVFAQEYAESDIQERSGDTEYAPSYIITPTGAKCNRLFIIGVITEVSDIGTEKELYRARVSDPTGTFLLYAGNFQPQATNFLSEVEPPEFIAATGKSNIYEPDEETTITSIRPEAINKSNELERDRWIIKTAERTLDRMKDINKRIKSHYGYKEQKYYEMIKESLKYVLDKTQETQETQETEKTEETEKEDRKRKEVPDEESKQKSKEPKKRDKTEDEQEESTEKEIEELDLTDL